MRRCSIFRIVRLFSLVVLAGWAARPAIPSEEPPSPPASVVLPPVTVVGDRPGDLDLEAPSLTGSRLGIPIREIPGSVTVIDKTEMDALGARTTREAAELAPGITGGEPPSTPGIFSSRGFSGNDVLLLYDGIAMGPPTMVARIEDTWKYDRVEVLKGPASVLYGEGALAGAINFVPKAPDPTAAGHELFASYGSFDTYRLGAGSGGPIPEAPLAYRLDFSRQSTDGFVDRTGYHYDDLSGALRWDPSSRLTLTFSFDAMWDDMDPYWGSPLAGGEVIRGAEDLNYNVLDGEAGQESQWLRLEAEWKATEAVTVRNFLYGYLADRNWKNVERYAFVPATALIRRSSPVEILHDQSVVGDRLDASFDHRPFDLENRFLAGLETHLDRFQRDSNRPDAGFDLVDPYLPDLGYFDGVRTVVTTPERSTSNWTGAVFIEDRLKPVEPFSLVGGLRGEVIDIDSENLRADTDFQETYTPLTGRIGGVLNVWRKLDLYAVYSTAAKPTTTLAVFDEANRDYRLEEGDMVEAGAKDSMFEDRVEWTLAFYRIEKRDQVTRDPADPSRSLQIGQQSSEGIEFDLATHPLEAWSVGGNVAVLDAAYDVFVTAAGASYSGNTPTNVPQVVGNAWTSYRLPWDVVLGARVRHVGEVQADNANTIQLPEYVTLDLFASYRYKMAEFGLRARNVLDEDYLAWSVGDGVMALRGEPLSVEGSIHVRF